MENYGTKPKMPGSTLYTGQFVYTSLPPLSRKGKSWFTKMDKRVE